MRRVARAPVPIQKKEGTHADTSFFHAGGNKTTAEKSGAFFQLKSDMQAGEKDKDPAAKSVNRQAEENKEDQGSLVQRAEEKEKKEDPAGKQMIQKNPGTILKAPQKDKDPETTRAQSVRDNYQNALKKKVIDWQEVALYFNAFNAPEMQSKMAQLNGRQLFLLHQGAVYGAGVGPWSAAALNTNQLPGIETATAASIEENILHNNYQAAIDLFVKTLDKMGIIDSRLLWGNTFHYLESANLQGEGRILAPGFDQASGKAKPVAANIGADAFSESKGLPFLYSTIIHEYQHVQQMQQQSDTKSKVPGQSADDDSHYQQEVEAYGTELLLAKQTGLYNIPEQVEDTWNRLQQRWERLSDTRKQPLRDLYKNAYTIAKEALGKRSFLVYTPVK